MQIVQRTREQAYEHWLGALESGQYPQARGKLRKGPKAGFCCIGVACDLAAKDGGPQWGPRGRFLETTANMPQAMANFLGMTQHEQGKLIDMNDTRRKPFSEIAKYIRAEIMPKALKRPVKYKSR